jgi:hypothetical protein
MLQLAELVLCRGKHGLWKPRPACDHRGHFILPRVDHDQNVSRLRYLLVDYQNLVHVAADAMDVPIDCASTVFHLWHRPPLRRSAAPPHARCGYTCGCSFRRDIQGTSPMGSFPSHARQRTGPVLGSAGEICADWPGVSILASSEESVGH